ncbi:MAG: hypothetical protein ACREGI_05555, partial [Candidatus Levyibacteriota bacterium]
IMVKLLDGKKAPLPQRPTDVISKKVCSTTGLLPPPDGTPNACPTRFEYFIKGTEPTRVDGTITKQVFVDKTTQTLAKPGQTDNVEQKTEQVITDPVGDDYCVTCAQPVYTSPTPTP